MSEFIAPEPIPPAAGCGQPSQRRRNPRSQQAILNAAVALLAEKGYAGVCIEAIASRAGVGKQTIYRWWPSKAAVLIDAYAAQKAQTFAIPDTGKVREDLQQLLCQSLGFLNDTTAGKAIAGLIAEAQTDPTVRTAFYDQFVSNCRCATAIILKRGRDRGELRSTLNPELVMDVLYGALWYRLLLQHAPLDEAFAQELIDQLFTGLSA